MNTFFILLALVIHIILFCIQYHCTTQYVSVTEFHSVIRTNFVNSSAQVTTYARAATKFVQNIFFNAIIPNDNVSGGGYVVSSGGKAVLKTARKWRKRKRDSVESTDINEHYARAFRKPSALNRVKSLRHYGIFQENAGKTLCWKGWKCVKRVRKRKGKAFRVKYGRAMMYRKKRFIKPPENNPVRQYFRLLDIEKKKGMEPQFKSLEEFVKVLKETEIMERRVRRALKRQQEENSTSPDSSQKKSSFWEKISAYVLKLFNLKEKEITEEANKDAAASSQSNILDNDCENSNERIELNNNFCTGCGNNSYPVYIQFPQVKALQVLTVDGDGTTAQIFEFLRTKGYGTHCSMRLMCGKKKLFDNQPLYRYNIQPESVISVNLLLRGGMQGSSDDEGSKNSSIWQSLVSTAAAAFNGSRSNSDADSSISTSSSKHTSDSNISLNDEMLLPNNETSVQKEDSVTRSKKPGRNHRRNTRKRRRRLKEMHYESTTDNNAISSHMRENPHAATTSQSIYSAMGCKCCHKQKCMHYKDGKSDKENRDITYQTILQSRNDVQFLDEVPKYYFIYNKLKGKHY